MRQKENKIRELRKKNGMSQAELAKKIKVSAQVISNWERNYSTPDIEHIQQLAIIFEVTTDYLLNMENEKNHPNSDGSSVYVFDEKSEKIKELVLQLNETDKDWLYETLLRLKQN